MTKKIHIFVTNYKEFSQAIQGEQCIRVAYSEHQLMERLNMIARDPIVEFGEEGFENMISYYQLNVSTEWDKVYLLEIYKVIHREFAIIIHLKFVGFLK